MAEYIERETFINEIRNIHAKHGLKENEEMLFSETDIIGIVECLPTADVATVRHGRWKLDVNPYSHKWNYKCPTIDENEK